MDILVSAYSPDHRAGFSPTAIGGQSRRARPRPPASYRSDWRDYGSITGGVPMTMVDNWVIVSPGGRVPKPQAHAQVSNDAKGYGTVLKWPGRRYPMRSNCVGAVAPTIFRLHKMVPHVTQGGDTRFAQSIRSGEGERQSVLSARGREDDTIRRDKFAMLLTGSLGDSVTTSSNGPSKDRCAEPR
jgi:hypothetical protein